MARRYSGAVRIHISWFDAVEVYVCRVVTDEGTEVVHVKPSPELLRTKAVDSSEAYDEIAKASLSFAEEALEQAGISLAELALFEPDGSGWLVARKKEQHLVFA